MIMYDEDPDVIRWGLDILNGYPSQSPGYCEPTDQNDANYYSNNYDREEASGPSHADEDNSQASVLAQDWIGSSVRNYNYGNEGCMEVVDDMEPSSSCSSPGEKYYEGEELPLELTDDFSALDGEVGKRLNQMVPIPHIPRINREIPSVDEATSDHERLLDRLRLYNLVELKVQGDGNCQVVGTLGYAAPEYVQSGRLTAKSDIWSYGVVLYELITGRPPIDHNRPKAEQHLLEWVRPYISDRRRFRLILDPRLDGQYSMKSALKLGAIANKCLVRVPKSRPKMSEVLEMVQKIVDAAETGPPQPLLMTYASEKDVEEAKKRKMNLKEEEGSMKEGKNKTVGLKRRLIELKLPEVWSVWRFWKRKGNRGLGQVQR